MLKFFLVVLIVANAALAALNAGYLEPWIASGHEPQRLQQQINPEKIRLIKEPPTSSAPISAAVRAPVSAPSVPVDAIAASSVAPLATPAATPSPTNAAQAVACIELGNFSEAEAGRLHAKLRDIVTADRLVQRRVADPSSFMVYIAPQGDTAGADRKVGELRRLGVRDFFVIQTEGDLRNAISLGIFKTRGAAETHLAELVRQGVRSARIIGRGESAAKIAFQLRGLDDATVAAAAKLANTEPHDCAPL